MPTLTTQEAAHAASIGDENATLALTPDARRPRVLVGSVIRKPPQVVAAFLATLRWQRATADLTTLFIPNFASGEPGRDEVLAMLRAAGGLIADNVDAPTGDYAEHDGVTRRWTPAAWHRLGGLKNAILDHAVRDRFDFVWLVDADVLCDPYTLQSLLDSADSQLAINHGVPAPIVAAVYWTRWQRIPD